MLLAIIFGLFGGAGLAFFFEYLDDTARTIEDVERVAKWPFLGNVPEMENSNALGELEKDLIVEHKPKDPISEVYRSIRTRIFFSSLEEHPLKSILITSPGPQEGKTTTLCNLGIAIAQNQRKVLLVDADMRKPRLHEVFKKENTRGLSGFLSGQAAFDDCVQKTEIANLYLISGGVIPPNPSELLESHKAKDFIARAKEKFDFVLFDSPPIGMLADAVIISGIADGTIMVVDSGKTSKRILARVHKLLDDVKARVIGVVLNRISIHAENYYYSYYYGKPKETSS